MRGRAAAARRAPQPGDDGAGSAQAYAGQYAANTNVKGKSRFDTGAGGTAGGGFGGDVTGKPFWGNPVSADRRSPPPPPLSPY